MTFSVPVVSYAQDSEDYIYTETTDADFYPEYDTFNSLMYEHNIRDTDLFTGGLYIRDMACAEYINGATEITNGEIKELYYAIEQASPYKNFICPVCGIEEARIFVYENVKFDNSTPEGKRYNSGLLKDQITYQICSPELFTVWVDNITEDEAEKINDYLNETYNITMQFIWLYDYFDESGEICPVYRFYTSEYHYLTQELAEEICADLREKGYVICSLYQCGSFDDTQVLDCKGTSCRDSIMYYPESAAADIKKIISESGVKADIIPFDDVNGIAPHKDAVNYITIDFPDTENTTQMDVVKLRTSIYKVTGLKGIDDNPEYVPVDDRLDNNDTTNYKTDNYKSSTGSSGDINSDGKADLTDITELSLYLIGDKDLTEDQLAAADVDGDDEVKLTDLAKFRQYLSKQIESLG